MSGALLLWNFVEKNTENLKSLKRSTLTSLDKNGRITVMFSLSSTVFYTAYLYSKVQHYIISPKYRYTYVNSSLYYCTWLS